MDRMKHKFLKGLFAILLSFCILILVLILIVVFRVGYISAYPNTIRAHEICGGQSLKHLDNSWMIVITRCYISSDNQNNIVDWYRSRGWYFSGERLVFPPILRLGPIGMEFGKQFLTEIKPDGSVLIVQQVIYRAGKLIIDN